MRRAIVATLIVLCAACGKSQPAPDATTTASSKPATSNAAKPPAPPPPALSAMTPLPAAVAPVAPETLAALLPEVSGWTRGAPKSEMVPKPAAYSRAEAHYQQGAGTIELVLSDSGFQPLVIAPHPLETSATKARQRPFNGTAPAAATGPPRRRRRSTNDYRRSMR